MQQQVKIAFDVLFSNAEIQSAKPVPLSIGSVGKLYIFATTKEITVSHQRLETSLKGPTNVARYSRCFESHTPWLQTVVLEAHPIHAQEEQVSHLLVHVPKPAKRQPYFKLRTNHRYLLTLGFNRHVPPSMFEVLQTAKGLIKTYEPQPIVTLPQNLKPLAMCGPNPFLERAFPAFQCNNPLEANLQQFLISCHAGGDGPLNVVKWARYSLFDLTTAIAYCEPGSAHMKQATTLAAEITEALNLLWQAYCSLGGGAEHFQADPFGVLSKLPPLYAQIIPLCRSIYSLPYAAAKRDLLSTVPIHWPHGHVAMQQLCDNGFVFSPTILQCDRAICRHCSFVGYAWRRLLPPNLHHHPTCAMAIR